MTVKEVWYKIPLEFRLGLIVAVLLAIWVFIVPGRKSEEQVELETKYYELQMMYGDEFKVKMDSVLDATELILENSEQVQTETNDEITREVYSTTKELYRDINRIDGYSDFERDGLWTKYSTGSEFIITAGSASARRDSTPG